MLSNNELVIWIFFDGLFYYVFLTLFYKFLVGIFNEFFADFWLEAILLCLGLSLVFYVLLICPLLLNCLYPKLALT